MRPDDYGVLLRHKRLDEEMRLGVTAGGMLAWLLLIGVYWRAVGTVRGAITEVLEQAEEKPA